MNLLRRLLGAPGRVTIATSTEAATAVGTAVCALHVPGARVGAMHTSAAGDTALTTVNYRYHHPHAEQRLLAEIQHVASVACAAQRIGQRSAAMGPAEVFVGQLGLNLTDWQRAILGRLP